MRLARRCGWAASALGLLAIAAAGARAGQVDVASNFQGWVNTLGDGNFGFNGNNTFTGNEFGFRFNSWSSFDLSGLSSTVTSASITLPLMEYPFGATAPYTLGLYDVSTPLSAFATNTSGVAGYTDLGSGNQYATATGSNGPVTMNLSAQAVADINAALGGIFIIGYTNLTLNPADPNGVDIGLYPNGLTGAKPILTLVSGAQAVPEPSTLALAGLGATIGAGCWYRRRKRVAAAA
jgi:hypothetical protein